MDHSLYAYSALPERTSGNAAPGLHAFAVLFLEHWEIEPVPGSLRDPRLVGEFGSFSPDYRSWTQREYGLRIGIFRVMDALKQAGITPVVAANAMAVERLPQLVQTLEQWGCEWLAHGIAATRMMHSKMPLAEQKSTIQHAIDTLHAATGRAPQGWLSQDWGTTPDTAGLLAEAGMRYTLDWNNDDQPYWLLTHPALLSIPLSAEWDDVQCQWLRFIEPRAHADLTVAAFERMRLECLQAQRHAVFGISIHPWLSGMSSRIASLRDMLARLRAYPDVIWTQPGQLFDSTYKT